MFVVSLEEGGKCGRVVLLEQREHVSGPVAHILSHGKAQMIEVILVPGHAVNPQLIAEVLNVN